MVSRRDRLGESWFAVDASIGRDWRDVAALDAAMRELLVTTVDPSSGRDTLEMMVFEGLRALEAAWVHGATCEELVALVRSGFMLEYFWSAKGREFDPSRPLALVPPRG